LENRHEYGTEEYTLQLLKACQKRTHMNCWEELYKQAFHQQKLLITEEQVSNTKPLFELAKITNTAQLKPQPVHITPCTGNNAHTNTR
jgi:hypothetical protein